MQVSIHPSEYSGSRVIIWPELDFLKDHSGSSVGEWIKEENAEARSSWNLLLYFRGEMMVLGWWQWTWGLLDRFERFWRVYWLWDMRGQMGLKENNHQGWLPGSWVESLVVWLLWRGRLGQDWVGLGNRKCGCLLLSSRYPWFHVSWSLHACHLKIASWRCVEPPCCWTLGLVFSHWKQAALAMKSSLYKPIALFPFGLFSKERCIWDVVPEVQFWVTGNEQTVLWLSLCVSRLSLERPS